MRGEKKKVVRGRPGERRTRTGAAASHSIHPQFEQRPGTLERCRLAKRVGHYAQGLNRVCSHNVSTNIPITASEPSSLDRRPFEGDQILVVERIFALAPNNSDVALVQPEHHAPADEFLRLVNRGLQHLALGREPEAVIDHLGVARH